MQFVDSWASEGKHHLIHFDRKVLEIFRKHRQRFQWQKEAGGILLGRYRGTNLEVVDATEPFPSDRRSRYSFKRNSIGHADAAMKQWVSSNGTITYVGEWHTHPQIDPLPSMLDVREWALLAKEYTSNPLMISVIAGTKSLYCAMLSPKDHAQMVPLDSDDTALEPRD